MAKVVDCDLEVSEFELLLHCYVPFRTNTLKKGVKLPYTPPYIETKPKNCSSTRMTLALDIP